MNRPLRRAQVLFDDAMLEEIIFGICKSQAWKDAGYSAEVRKSCAPRVAEHVLLCRCRGC